MSYAQRIIVLPDRLAGQRIHNAILLQRKGRTFREIADAMQVTIEAVEQALYWDRVQS